MAFSLPWVEELPYSRWNIPMTSAPPRYQPSPTAVFLLCSDVTRLVVWCCVDTPCTSHAIFIHFWSHSAAAISHVTNLAGSSHLMTVWTHLPLILFQTSIVSHRKGQLWTKGQPRTQTLHATASAWALFSLHCFSAFLLSVRGRKSDPFRGLLLWNLLIQYCCCYIHCIRRHPVYSNIICSMTRGPPRPSPWR